MKKLLTAGQGSPLSTLLAIVLAAGSSWVMGQERAQSMRHKSFKVEEMNAERVETGRAFLEFLKVEDMSAGLYVLGPGAADRQSPHGEAEVYYIVEGKGVLRVDDVDIPVETGSFIYVKATVPHRFHSIEQELKVLVVFAPAFGSSRQ